MAAPIDDAVRMMTDFVSDQKFGSITEGLIQMFQSGKQRHMSLTNDESYEDNVKFIKDKLGDSVVISTDFPPFYEVLALSVQDNEYLMKLDGAMQIALAGAVKSVMEFQKSHGGYISWKNLRTVFESKMGNLFTYDPREGHSRCMTDHVCRSGTAFTLFDNATREEDMVEAEVMMKNLVNDEVIWNNLKIDKNKLSKIFASETIDWTKQLFGGSSQVGHVAIDVGLLRFPSSEDPFVQLHRFRVIVMASQAGFLGFTTSFNGIVAEIITRRYSFNDVGMREIRARHVTADVNDLFAGLGLPI